MGARESGNGVLILADCFPAAGRNHAMDMRMMLKGDVQDAPLDVSGALRPLVFFPHGYPSACLPDLTPDGGSGKQARKALLLPRLGRPRSAKRWRQRPAAWMLPKPARKR